MTPHREILRKADDVVERARASGALDRRAFMRLSTLGIGATILSACNSAGPKSAEREIRTLAARAEYTSAHWQPHAGWPPFSGVLGERFGADVE
jgi:hypothetical protein